MNGIQVTKITVTMHSVCYITLVSMNLQAWLSLCANSYKVYTALSGNLLPGTLLLTVGIMGWWLQAL
jgi:hypothetical protein